MAKYSCIIKKHKNSLYGFNTIVKIGQEQATISEWLQKILSNQLEILYNQKIDISKTDDQINGTIKLSWDGDDSTEWASDLKDCFPDAANGVFKNSDKEGINIQFLSIPNNTNSIEFTLQTIITEGNLLHFNPITINFVGYDSLEKDFISSWEFAIVEIAYNSLTPKYIYNNIITFEEVYIIGDLSNPDKFKSDFESKLKEKLQGEFNYTITYHFNPIESLSNNDGSIVITVTNNKQINNLSVTITTESDYWWDKTDFYNDISKLNIYDGDKLITDNNGEEPLLLTETDVDNLKDFLSTKGVTYGNIVLSGKLITINNIKIDLLALDKFKEDLKTYLKTYSNFPAFNNEKNGNPPYAVTIRKDTEGWIKFELSRNSVKWGNTYIEYDEKNQRYKLSKSSVPSQSDNEERPLFTSESLIIKIDTNRYQEYVSLIELANKSDIYISKSREWYKHSDGQEGIPATETIPNGWLKAYTRTINGVDRIMLYKDNIDESNVIYRMTHDPNLYYNFTTKISYNDQSIPLWEFVGIIMESTGMLYYTNVHADNLLTYNIFRIEDVLLKDGKNINNFLAELSNILNNFGFTYSLIKPSDIQNNHTSYITIKPLPEIENVFSEMYDENLAKYRAEITNGSATTQTTDPQPSGEGAKQTTPEDPAALQQQMTNQGSDTNSTQKTEDAAKKDTKDLENTSNTGSSNSTSQNKNDDEKSDENEDTGEEKNSPDNSEGREESPISFTMRKGLRKMAAVVQCAQYVSLLPKPQDFIMTFATELALLTNKIQRSTKELQTIINTYVLFPTNYISNNLQIIRDNTTGWLNNLEQDVKIFGESTQKGFNGLKDVTQETITIGLNSVGNMAIATNNLATSAVVLTHLEASNAEFTQDVIEDAKMFEEGIHESVNELTEDAMKGLNNASKFLNKETNKLTNYIHEREEKLDQFLQKQLKKIQKLSNKLSTIVDEAFGQLTNVTELATALADITVSSVTIKDKNTFDPDERYDNEKIQQNIQNFINKKNNLISNFDIFKIIKGCVVVGGASALCALQLDQLPDLDVNRVLKGIKGSLMNEKTQKTTVLPGDIDTVYNLKIDDDQYQKFVQQFHPEIQKNLNAIRQSLKNKLPSSNSTAIQEQKNKYLNDFKTIAEAIRKQKKEADKVKKCNNLKKDVTKQLKKIQIEFDIFGKNLSNAWNNVFGKYKNCISECKRFFQDDGAGAKAITNKCFDINDACADIKEKCRQLTQSFVGLSCKTSSAPWIGPGAPSIMYFLGNLYIDISAIVQFIVGFVRDVLKIIQGIGYIAEIMAKGLNSLNDIFNQIWDLVGLGWLLNLVDQIMDMASSSFANAKAQAANLVEPVLYSDTREYEIITEVLENLTSASPDKEMMSTLLNSLEDSVETEPMNNIRNMSISQGIIDTYLRDPENEDNINMIEGLMDELDDKEDDIVAYRCIVFKPEPEKTKEEKKDTTQKENRNFPTTIKEAEFQFEDDILGWQYFHPNLNHSKLFGGGLINKIRKRIKSKIIKKASKKSLKKRGGVNMLNRKKIKGSVTAYEGFAWFFVKKAYPTPDDVPQGYDTDSIWGYNRSTGSLVNVVMNGENKRIWVAQPGVKKGDIINVNGQKIRVN